MNLQTLKYGHRWYYTTTKGSFPMKEARQYGLSIGNSVFVALQVHNKRMFSSFRTLHAFWMYYMAYPDNERCFYFVNYSHEDSGYVCPLYMDIEWKTCNHGGDPRPLERLRHIVDMVKDVTQSKVRIFSNSRQKNDFYYHSYHLVWGDATFESQLHIRAFMNDVIMPRVVQCDELFYFHGGCRKSIIDMKVYSKCQSMRVPGSHKFGDDPINLPPNNDGDIYKYMITGRIDFAPKIKHDIDPPKSIITRPTDMTPDPIMLSKVKGLVSDHGDPTSVIVHHGHRFFIGLPHNEGRTCLIDHHTCKQQFHVNVDSHGRVWYHCFASCERHGRSDGRFLGYINDEVEVSWDDVGRFTGTRVEPDRWGGKVHVNDITTHSGYVSPIVHSFGKKCTVVIAGVGEGKTTAAKKVTDTYGPDSRILFVTTRISHSYSLLQQFGDFAHYKEDAKFYNSNRVIIQYESLHRLVGCRRFDLIIIDEVRSVLQTALQRVTNGNNIGVNIKILRALMDEAGWTLCMGADVECDGMVPGFLLSVYRPSEIEVSRYKNFKIRRHLHFLRDRNTFLSNVSRHLGNGKRCAILCRTKRRVGDLVEYFSAKYKDKKIRSITSDTDSDDVKLVMSDVNSWLADVDLFLYTSKVSVGVDITLDWDNCFLDVTGGNGCDARGMTQMIGRFRSLVDRNIDVLVSPSPKFEGDHEDSYIAHALSSVQARKRMASTDVVDIFRFDPSFEDGIIVLSPSWFTQMYVHDIAERQTPFLCSLLRLSCRKRWECTLVPCDEPSTVNDEFKRAMDTSKKVIDAKLRDVYNKTSKGDIDAIISVGTDLCKKGVITNNEQLELQTALVLRHWKDAIPDFDGFKVAMKNVQKLKRRYRFENMDNNQNVRLDLNSTKKRMWTDVYSNFNTIAFDAVRTLLDTIGLKDLRDSSEIPVQQLNMCAPSIDKLFTTIKTAMDLRSQVRTPQSQVAACLRELFAVTFSSRQVRLNGNRVRRYYIKQNAINEQLISTTNFGYAFGDDIPYAHIPRERVLR